MVLFSLVSAAHGAHIRTVLRIVTAEITKATEPQSYSPNSSAKIVSKAATPTWNFQSKQRTMISSYFEKTELFYGCVRLRRFRLTKVHHLIFIHPDLNSIPLCI